MPKINFKEFNLYTSIAQDDTRTFDVREALSNGMYMTMQGIRAHDLALRIFRSDGEIEISDEDMAIIHEYAKNLTPVFMDSLLMNISDKK